VHPIVGARRLDQLEDNLQALNIRLPPESVARLEAATGFEIGFPHDFITDMHTFVFGEAAERVDQAATTPMTTAPLRTTGPATHHPVRPPAAIETGHQR
jgi:hypothetical protein